MRLSKDLVSTRKPRLTVSIPKGKTPNTTLPRWTGEGVVRAATEGVHAAETVECLVPVQMNGKLVRLPPKRRSLTRVGRRIEVRSKARFWERWEVAIAPRLPGRISR